MSELGGGGVAPDAVSPISGGGGSGGPYSAPFTVTPADQPSPTGTKYVVFPNGARAPFTLSGGALPTASTPTVACVVPAGYPLLITCYYNATQNNCYYTVTFADQTQWTLLPALYTGGEQLIYGLSHLQDRVGNGLDFVYGNGARFYEMFMTGGIPLLASIQDSSTGNTLLTLVRDGNGCVIEAQDCYGRSVYYGNTLLYSSGGLGVGNRTEITANLPSVTSLSGNTSYTYDTKDQLTAELSARGSGLMDSFAYDSAGNATTFRNNSVSYNSNNQRTGTGFAYDGNGCPTTYGGTSLSFDANEKLVAVGTVWAAGYNCDGVRVWKQNGVTSTITYFLYDDDDPIIELNSGGSVVAINTFGANGLISRKVTGADTTFYTFDERGSVAQRLTPSGTVASSDLYSAFGSLLSGGSDPFGFGAQTGYYTDNETGLILCGLRYYDPGNGRWLTRDPIGYEGGINIYGYCQNNPVIGSDSTGLQSAATWPIGLAPIALPALPLAAIAIGTACAANPPACIIIGVGIVVIGGGIWWWLHHHNTQQGTQSCPYVCPAKGNMIPVGKDGKIAPVPVVNTQPVVRGGHTKKSGKMTDTHDEGDARRNTYQNCGEKKQQSGRYK